MPSAIKPDTPSSLGAHEEAVAAIQKDFEDLEIELLREATRKREVLFEKRHDALAKIENFWAQTLLNSDSLRPYLDNDDMDALSYLTDFKVEKPLAKESGDPRALRLTFSFKENPYFSNKALVKEFKLVKDAPPLEIEFELIDVIETTKVTIDWKDDEHNLSKKNPLHHDPEDDDSFDPGSFFACLFENDHAPSAVAPALALSESLYPNAIQVYTGERSDQFDVDFSDSDDEDDEDNEDPNAEIDLEDDEPPKKKAKN